MNQISTPSGIEMLVWAGVCGGYQLLRNSHPHVAVAGFVGGAVSEVLTDVASRILLPESHRVTTSRQAIQAIHASGLANVSVRLLSTIAFCVSSYFAAKNLTLIAVNAGFAPLPVAVTAIAVTYVAGTILLTGIKKFYPATA